MESKKGANVPVETEVTEKQVDKEQQSPSAFKARKRSRSPSPSPTGIYNEEGLFHYNLKDLIRSDFDMPAKDKDFKLSHE